MWSVLKNSSLKSINFGILNEQQMGLIYKMLDIKTKFKDEDELETIKNT